MSKLYAQMYSVKDQCEKDFPGAIRQIAAIGYDGIELAGYYEETPETIKDLISELNLEVLSAHVSLEALRNDLVNQISALKLLGAKYIVCPFSEARSLESADQIGQELKEIGKTCQEHGLPLLYHNHAHELSGSGQHPLDRLFDVAGEVLMQEPDVYWLAYGGVDPIPYLKAHEARCKVIHLKQMADQESKKNVVAGAGYLPFKEMMATFKDAYFIYEQEHFETDSMTGMAQAYETLRAYFG